MPKLSQQFYQQKTVDVAKQLLGKFLVLKQGTQILSGMIVETESYIGPHDLACHASRGRTPRTQVMFGEAGVWYVYMIYGMYFNLNVITEEKEYPAAVLIRALEPCEGIAAMQQKRRLQDLHKLTNGPGKLCQALGIDKKYNCTSATSPSAKLYIEDRGYKVANKDIIKAKRIGIDYSGIWKDKLLRFYLKDNKFVSKK